MKISISKLGPISKSELKLGDITVLLGPPNVGKSYTLKSIYASLIMLDSTARNLLLELFSEDLILFIRPISLLSTLLPVIYHFSPGKKEIVKRIYCDEIPGVEDVSIEKENDIITTVLKVKQSLSLGKLNRLIGRKISSLCEIVPVDENTEIKMDPSLVKLLPSFLERALKEPVKARQIEEYNKKLKYSLKYKISSKFEEEKQILEIEILIKTHLDIKSPLCKKERFRTAAENILTWYEHKLDKPKLKKEDVKDILPDVFKFLTIEIPIKYSFEIEKTTQQFVNNLLDKIGETIENAWIPEFYTVLFLPFGRSPFVYQLDSIAHEPSRWMSFEDIYESDIISRSYMSKLSKGRSKFLKGNYEKKIFQIFEPLLQGNLTFDRKTKEIKYKRWGQKEISLKWASALAGEITGILLPLLTVKNPALLIIEEPESQLHCSAHILMALTLIALSKLYKHKIIVSTHSDILTLALAYVKEYKPHKTKIFSLVEELLTLQGIHDEEINLDLLAEAVSDACDMDIRFYYYKPNSTGTEVLEKKPSEIIKEVPGITQVIDTFATWGIDL